MVCMVLCLFIENGASGSLKNKLPRNEVIYRPIYVRVFAAHLFCGKPKKAVAFKSGAHGATRQGKIHCHQGVKCQAMSSCTLVATKPHLPVPD